MTGPLPTQHTLDVKALLGQLRIVRADLAAERARSRGLDLTDEEMARVKVPHRHWCARSERSAAACDCGAAGLMGRVREALSTSPGSGRGQK